MDGPATRGAKNIWRRSSGGGATIAAGNGVQAAVVEGKGGLVTPGAVGGEAPATGGYRDPNGKEWRIYGPDSHAASKIVIC